MNVLRAKPDVRLYLLSSFHDTPRMVTSDRAEIVYADNPTTISNCISTTGALGHAIEEQALIIDTLEGAVVITGCAHPGIVRIVEKARELIEAEIMLVMGGFHLKSNSEGEIGSIIYQLKELGVKNVGPSHCTGDTAIAAFERAFKERFIQLGTGNTIDPLKL